MTPEILFDPPPQNLEILNGGVHVFCAALDQPLPKIAQFAETLSADERARAARFVFQRDRNYFIAGRGILREILGWLLRADPAQLAFAYGDHGKPRLAAPVEGRYLHFNLAHSDTLAVYAFSGRQEVGIDIEQIRPLREAEEIAARLFPECVNSEWRALPASRQMEEFFGCWTRSEALLKAAGAGIDKLPIQIKHPSSADEFGLPNKLDDTISTFPNLFFHSFTPAYSYAGSVATGSAGAPCYWSWLAQNVIRTNRPVACRYGVAGG